SRVPGRAQRRHEPAAPVHARRNPKPSSTSSPQESASAILVVRKAPCDSPAPGPSVAWRTLAPALTLSGLAGGGKPFSRLIDPFVQIAQNTRGHTPDITLTERHGVVFPCHALPVAAVQRVVLRVHQEGERYLEGVGDLRLVDHQPVT